MAKLGLFYIAACEGVLSFVLGLYSIFLFVIAFWKRDAGLGTRVLLTITAGLVIGAMAAFCFYSATALLRYRRWAWYVAWIWAFPVFAFGGFVLYAIRADRAPYVIDPGIGVVFSGTILFLAIVGLVVLSLPAIRRLFFASVRVS